MIIEIPVVLTCHLDKERVGGSGTARLIDVGAQFGSCSIILADQPLITIKIIGAIAAHFLPQPAPEGIIVIFALDTAACTFNALQAVVQAKDKIRGGAAHRFAGHIALAVVAEGNTVIAPGAGASGRIGIAFFAGVQVVLIALAQGEGPVIDGLTDTSLQVVVAVDGAGT